MAYGINGINVHHTVGDRLHRLANIEDIGTKLNETFYFYFVHRVNHHTMSHTL